MIELTDEQARVVLTALRNERNRVKKLVGAVERSRSTNAALVELAREGATMVNQRIEVIDEVIASIDPPKPEFVDPDDYDDE